MTPRETPSAVSTADGRVLTGAGGPRPGEATRLDHLFERLCDREADRLAVDAGAVRLTFGDLDARANRLARHLLARGVRPGDRIGLLLTEPVDSYVAMLAVLKAGAAYVPLDAAFPDDRLAFILRDAGVRLVLTASPLRDRFGEGKDLLCVDEEAARITARPGTRPAHVPAGDLCYVVYTSGSTGRPKGVPIHHAAIGNFVGVAAEAYGLGPGDRVYQGMTIAFDFSVEEIWVPLLSGATLVPRPAGGAPAGAELQDFLRATGITALCCVPTLLATLEDDLPDLRFLLVSGEACPEDLVARWSRPGRRFLNVYGPTETTVTATWSVLHPDRPVTIGVPLPTYSVVILDPAEPRALPAGELGEIGIAGAGLAEGYLNRPDLTERAFIPDFLGIDGNPSGRIYRTGDLGRITADGEIEYHGRTDTQVKVRGYRIELTEIESILLRAPGVAQAVVGTHEPEPGTTELVAYYSLRRDAPGADPGELRRLLRERLPAYMVPAYFERLDRIPMTPSHKADRAHLPAPAGPRALAAETAYTPPETNTERLLAGALAEVCRLDRVSVTAHFFADLAADSLLLAKFCSRVRESGELTLPVKQLYLHPTVRELARSVPAARPRPVRTGTPHRASTPAHVLCGAYQLLVFLAYIAGSAVLADTAYDWVSAAGGLLDGYLRAVAAAGTGFAALCVVPVVVKWLLVGRWQPGEIPLWSPAYLRFWTVKTVTRFCPLALFAGSPLYSLYLRLLGAKIGAGAVILVRRPPVCTDLLTVGAGAVIRKDASIACYRAEAGRIRTGRVTIGNRAFVGETAVLDIGTALGDDAQLGHSSSLAAGQAVPAGEHWHGSPGRPSTVDYQALPAGLAGRARRTAFAVAQLASFLLVTTPLTLALGTVVAHFVQPAQADLTGWAFYRDQLASSTLLYAGALAGGLTLVLTLPRLLAPFLVPDRVYPLYGFHHAVQRAIARLTNLRTFTYLFGDSSYIVHYLRALGYDLSQVRQTGSNFGVEVKHETPFLCTVGTGTMVSDGLSLLNADYSGSSFRLRRTAVAPETFLGNDIAYPPGARVGRNCLLATKVLVPLDGPVREDVGLLGSPAFEIPRSVRRDRGFDHLWTGAARRRGLAAKLRHNTATMGWYLVVQWLNLTGVLGIGVVAGGLHPRFGAFATAGGIAGALLFSVLFLVLAERAAQGFRRLRPRFCSIYDPVFWRHERFWKLSPGRHLALFDGTPFKGVLWRLLGVRIGRRVYDDGCGIPEKSLVTIGDDVVLNAGSVLQCHSLEDGTFKSDHTTVGAGSTIGVGAFVHYGVTVGEGTVVEADAFLMKGSVTPPRSRWRGNPATEGAGELVQGRVS
ncbi:non-ribosomal peptide synthetase-like protein [Amycolatopsis lexingtonensis]|uniref:Non-ribosomal peptide synthetase-like protein n=3 Tax=Amycolatopsis lexingtonensis TaxID=218822 RepID=A0ABR9HVY6_9PSEU|nr:non-ribosomal peptide synthetase-like protein [Amycolatopsis lexingtonensis]